METNLSAPTAPALGAIEAARARIADTIVRTPLIELQGTTGPRIFLKMENLQPINSFKLRGAANAVAMLDPGQRVSSTFIMIELKNIQKSFGDKQILRGVSAVMETGKTNLIIGTSGSGKTVLEKCMVGLFEVDEGEILYDGKNFTDYA